MKSDNIDKQNQAIWLNVASGYCVLEKFINLDNDIFYRLASFYPLIKPLLSKEHRRTVEEYKAAKKSTPFLKCDCRKPLPFSDGSVGHILCSHFLEHVYSEQATRILCDFKRVLKNDGTLHIILPDLNILIDQYIASKATENAADIFVGKILMSSQNRPSFRFRLFEFFRFEGLKHRWMYTFDSMALKLKECGFELIDSTIIPSAHVRINDGESVHLFARKRTN